MGDIDAIMDGEETILWQGKSALLPFFAGGLLSFVFGVGILAIAANFLAGHPTGQHTDPIAALLFLSPFLLAGFLLAVVYPLWRLFAYLRLSYVITTKRVVSQHGVIEHDVVMADFDQIANASVDISLTDIFLGFGRTGSVSLITRGSLDEKGNEDQTAILLSHIHRPYAVFGLFHRAEFDVKTDIQYPNRLRPDTNPGYSTTYTPPPQP